MSNRNTKILRIATVVAAGLSVLALGVRTEAVADSVSELHTKTHIHGLAVDRADPAYLLIATHHGLLRAKADGTTELISVVQDFMGFNPHPSDPNTLYASGHPAGGGNLGFIASTDRGKTWSQISPGLNGPVDFHQMSVSPAEPATIYGNYDGLQISRDRGATWQMAGPPLDGLIALAASARSADILYAATEQGLFASYDTGKTWKPLLEGSPVTAIDVTPGGIIHAFVFRKGLLRSREEPLDWETLSTDWGERYLLHLAIDPADADRIYAATGESEVLASKDGGATWTAFGK